MTGVKHQSVSGAPSLDLAKFCRAMVVPVIVGNCVSYEIALSLMETGVAGILVGIGPGAACTSRSVLGIGIPMATAIADCAAAREDFAVESGRRPLIIADGGMVVGGDICKAIACGADAVMIGSPLARAKEAPGHGYHWGMAPHQVQFCRAAHALKSVLAVRLNKFLLVQHILMMARKI